MNELNPAVRFLESRLDIPLSPTLSKKGAYDHVFTNRHPGKRFDDLEGPRYPHSGNNGRLQPIDAPPLKVELPPGERINTCHEIHKRCFSRPVWSDQTQNFACLDLEINLIDRSQGSKQF